MPPIINGIAWYRRDDYARLLTILEDADKLPRTFDDWLKKAEAHEKKLSTRGMRVMRVIIDPDAFPGWCLANGLNVDAEARRKFVGHKAHEEFLKSN